MDDLTRARLIKSIQLDQADSAPDLARLELMFRTAVDAMQVLETCEQDIEIMVADALQANIVEVRRALMVMTSTIPGFNDLLRDEEDIVTPLSEFLARWWVQVGIDRDRDDHDDSAS